MIQKTVKTNDLILLCQKCKTLNQLKQIHAHLLTSTRPENPYAIAPLLSAAAKDASLFPYACAIFKHHHHHRNTFMYNTMIRAHAQSHAPVAAVLCYLDLLNYGLIANKFTFPPLIKACSILVHNSELTGRSVHAHVVKFGFGDDPFVVSGLIEFYSVILEMGAARLVFDKSPSKDVVVWTAMVDGFGKIGDVENARKVFDEMPERNAVSWSAMMAAYSRVSDFREVVCLFRQMQEVGTRPNESVLVSVLTAAAHLGAVAQGLWVHSYAKRQRLESNRILATALVDMYSKCGYVEAAMKVFEGICNKDARAWNAMITGVAMNGDARKSIELLDKMVVDKIQPTETTFVAVLSACTHAKMVDKGLELFDQMSTLYGVEPMLQHYACVVDLLARAGMLEEAEKFIEDKMGGLGRGDANVWGALLGACRVHGNVEVGDRIWKKLADMGVADCGIHVLSYNMYKEAGLELEAKRVRDMISEGGMKKKPGSSVIEVNGVAEEFIVGDLCPPQAQEMLKILDSFCKMVNLEDV
ncbi:putative tetratricopeptide-like helical domain-containing protein [Rosa chinensis]|uniref:Putative tetratricopeptide-like helical domain-containing protein n=1 Tax=Rosa chinensis TaxID=74649 RepID=A0A2P6RIY0_ROSCH|nr:pentatricopeptide repeat-containing protein At5g48910 [Rosa chinensis]PRQ46388.1 putative tetratricopeptide-like helical domain-containing protein [Rosa chinensis]